MLYFLQCNKDVRELSQVISAKDGFRSYLGILTGSFSNSTSYLFDILLFVPVPAGICFYTHWVQEESPPQSNPFKAPHLTQENSETLDWEWWYSVILISTKHLKQKSWSTDKVIFVLALLWQVHQQSCTSFSAYCFLWLLNILIIVISGNKVLSGGKSSWYQSLWFYCKQKHFLCNSTGSSNCPCAADGKSLEEN